MPGTDDFAINARFLGQAETGVQRYARNVTEAIARDLQRRGQRARLIAPKGIADPGLASLGFSSAGRLPAQLWEQIELPVKWRGPLLSLCNAGPALKSNQIVCLHDANVYTQPESYSTAFKTWYRLMQRPLVRRAAQVTTVSANAAGQIAQFLPVKLSDILVLPNGHEHALAWTPGAATRMPALFAKDGTLHDQSFVLALGSRARHKNLDLLYRLAAPLAEINIKIVIAGGSAAPFSATGEAPASIVTTGRISDDDLAYLMDRALCLAFPSFTEGFGLPIVEAMARGCPVVSSDRASLPEVCGNAALMAAPDDEAIWLHHITRLNASPALRAELTVRGHDQVKRFSWAETAKTYLELMSLHASAAT